MTEEEIIKEIEIIKEAQDIMEHNLDIYPPKEDIYRLDTKQLKAVICLLDLYNKQKEENKKDIKGYSKMINSLEEQLAHKTKEIKELNSEFALNTEIHKRDEEIKELKDTIKCLHEPSENYISKDKIKDKMLELEKEKDLYFEKQIIQGRIDLLKELLEEE